MNTTPAAMTPILPAATRSLRVKAGIRAGAKKSIRIRAKMKGEVMEVTA